MATSSDDSPRADATGWLPRPLPAPTPRPGPGERAASALSSPANIAGCASALLGAVLTAVGVVDWPLWPPVVAGLYGVGALVAPRRPAPPPEPAGIVELRAALGAQRRLLATRAPADVVAAADEVYQALDELLGAELTARADPSGLFVVERTVADYLPTALETYLGMPRTYAETHRLADGRTPRAVLSETLSLLAAGTREMTEAIASGDTTRLLAQRRFLTTRFGTNDLTLGRDQA